MKLLLIQGFLERDVLRTKFFISLGWLSTSVPKVTSNYSWTMNTRVRFYQDYRSKSVYGWSLTFTGLRFRLLLSPHVSFIAVHTVHLNLIYQIRYSDEYAGINNFIAGNAPVEVLARGPEALRVYQQACADGSVSSRRSRLALIGCECREKMIFKKLLLNLASSEVSQSRRKAIDCSFICQTDEEGSGKPWKLVTAAAPPSVDTLMNELYDSDDSSSSGK